MITKTEIEERAAKAAHEANAVYSESHGDHKPAWDDLPDDHWMKTSYRELVAVLAAGVKPKSAEEQHEAWMASRRRSGWVFGKVKDGDAAPPTHPSLIPFDQLPRSEQLKDDLAVRVVCATLGISAPF